ncbi:DUF3290 family protein [Companilactobacillus ginsenosidimutans]|uniref:DUF3290 domain-containing protein n=1 Tax=Companilactobacillus ginsenosidimutans TaxID=1007676 RepID=A0A0H4QN00_9LACO|nr:DUF3290 family protein [Companilactobacillus ginsenosidimutans]AKP68108.1 hypothetical protein ABM34_11565 [Companilactobacillus ginsenosidimutans]
MTFYSYDYLVQQNSTPNVVFITVTIILVAALLFTGYRYIRNRADNKYRDLFIIFVMGAALFIGINYNNYEKQLDISNKTNQTLTLMRSVAKVKNVSVKKLYSNTSTPAEGMLIKNGKYYYRVSFDNNQNSYTLTNANILNTKTVNLQK